MESVRNVLETLRSYEPNNFSNADSTLPFDITSAKHLYCQARDKYLNQRMEEMMMEYVSSYNEEKGFVKPDLSFDEESCDSKADKAAVRACSILLLVA